MKNETKGIRWARMFGTGLAHVQHATDVALDLSFSFLKKVGEQQEEAPKTDIKNEYVRNAVNVCKGAMNFVGTLGEQYYEKYEELKKKHK